MGCLHGRITSARAFGYGKSGPRTTLRLPGTGLSWSVEHDPGTPSALPAGLPNSRRFRRGQLEAFRQGGLEVLQEQLFAPGSSGQRLREQAA